MLYTPASKSSNTTPNEFLIFLSTQLIGKTLSISKNRNNIRMNKNIIKSFENFK